MTATLKPLTIDVSQFGMADQHCSTIHANMARGLPEFQPSLVAHDGSLVLVASGPSAPQFIEEIRVERQRGRPICAINGAHDLLCENGIEPDLFLTVDPRDLRHNVRKHNAHTTYMLASRASLEMFDYLKDRHVVLWHAFGTQGEMKAYKDKVRFCCGGGSTSGLRGIALGYLMGFRKFILYGYDSCNAADGVTKRFDGGKSGVTQDVVVGGRTFICNLAMAAQANEFQLVTYSLLPDIHIEAKGDGLIAAILDERKRQGKVV